MLGEERSSRLWPSESVKGQVTSSLQRPQNKDVWREFNLRLGGWFPALKWLVKEFRLRIGYETPDEEAGIRFWIRNFAPSQPSPQPPSEPASWVWPTADEPVVSATKEEVRQARRWTLEEVERQMTSFFELKRQICPSTPILVPLKELRLHQVKTGRASSPEQMRLHRKEAARPSLSSSRAWRPAGRACEAVRSRSQGGAVRLKALSREARERLYPKSPAASRHAPATSEAFVSCLIDLAIEFKADAVRAGRDGARYLRSPRAGTDLEAESQPDHWREGVSSLRDLGLLQFWLALPDKARLGLLLKPEGAQKAIQEYVSGKGVAEKVSRAFSTKFGYQTRDVNVLYRFWQSMPIQVRSSQQVRGFANHEVLELLQAYGRERAEESVVPPKSPRSGRSRGPWRPAGDHLEATQTLTSPAITPRGQGQKRDLNILARSRPRVDALEFIRAIAKRFPEDNTLKHMLKQCLEGAPSSAATDSDAYNLLVDTTVLKQASRDKAPKPAAGRMDARLKLQLPVQAEGSFQDWLNQDAERAGRFLLLLQDAGKVSKGIRRYMRHRAKQCLARGARLGPTGPVVPARNRTEVDLPALYVIEDTFAHLCRRFGANEIYVRFGPYYLCRTVNDSKESKPLIEEIADPASGAVVDCRAQSTSCGPSTAQLHQNSGWHPDIASPEFSQGGSWWQVDLGRLHSCAGVRLEWCVPSIKKVTYATRAQFQSDLLLADGDSYQIVVTQVRQGGTAFLARVKPGDVLQLNAGGNADDAFVGLSPTEALAKLANDFSQPLTLVFKGPQLSGESQRLQRLLETPLKVKVFISKKDVVPSADSPDQWEQIQEQDLTVTTQHPCIVSTVFVARWVRLQFETPWPKLDNEALALSVKVMKVWRLAPPLFRQQFLEVLRQVERQTAKGHALVRQPFQERRFWASSVKPQSFNMVINMDVVRRVKRSHDSEGDEMLALQTMCLRERKEFNILRSDEILALRQRIFSKEEDILECTFHPRTAANVPGHVYKFRERISDRMDDKKVTGIKDFVKDLGEEFKAHKYPNYWKVHRRAMLQKAKRDFVRGALKSAMDKLQRHFGVQQMLDRFRCYHKNCGRKLDHHAEICKCAGFYCHIHKPPQVHNCKDMKKLLEAKAKEAKDLEIKLREEGGDPPPEEKFDNKVEIGLLLEAHELAESIQAAMKEKDRQKHSLERLGQSLASFGAVRLMERPFKRRMCPYTVEKRRARSAEAPDVLPRWMGASAFNPEVGPRTPRLGSRSGSRERCKCPNAHSPSELRFPAGESVQRRMDWVKKAVRRADLKSETVPNSAAERELLEKKKKEEEKAPGPPPTQTGETPRVRLEPLKKLVLRVLDEKAFSLKHAFGLCCEARALLEEYDHPKAELRVNEARELAQNSLQEALASDAELLSKVGQAKAKRVWRPLKDYEKEEMKQRRSVVQEEAEQILNVCKVIQEEVELRRKSEPQTLPPPPPAPGSDTPLPPPPPRLPGLRAFDDDLALARLLAQAAEEPQAGGMAPVERKREMCAQFLEVGACILDQNCPFAHCPSELFGHGYPRSPEKRQVDLVKRLAEEQGQVAKQLEQAVCASAYDRSVAAADDATLRRLLLVTDVPATPKRW